MSDVGVSVAVQKQIVGAHRRSGDGDERRTDLVGLIADEVLEYSPKCNAHGCGGNADVVHLQAELTGYDGPVRVARKSLGRSDPTWEEASQEREPVRLERGARGHHPGDQMTRTRSRGPFPVVSRRLARLPVRRRSMRTLGTVVQGTKGRPCCAGCHPKQPPRSGPLRHAPRSPNNRRRPAVRRQSPRRTRLLPEVRLRHKPSSRAVIKLTT